MSVIRSQPSPYGHLKREKHIEHFSRTPNEERNVCMCMKTQHKQQKLQWDHKIGTQARNNEKNGKQAHKMMCNHKRVPVVNKGCCATASTTSNDAPLPNKRSTEGERGIQRMLAVVEELDEAISSELQVLAGIQQFCITSRARQEELSCHPERLYIISSRSAKQLLVATEDSSCLCYHLCGPARSCCLRLCDQSKKEVLRFCRPYRVDVCCLCCYLMVIRVFSAPNKLLGSVQQRWSIFSPKLAVCDAEGKRIMEITGSWSANRCQSDQEFEVTSLDGHILAIIWKRWPGFNEEYNMDHDFFGLDITSSVSQNEKALLLAAAFLLNFMFFEMS